MQSLLKIIVLWIVISVVGLGDVVLCVKQLFAVRESMRVMQQEILEFSQRRVISSQPSFKQASDGKTVESFLDQAKRAGLIFQSVSSEKIGNTLLMNAVLHGNFFQLRNFFAEIKSCPFDMNQIELAADNSQLKISLDFSLLGLCDDSSNKKPLKMTNDPFVVDVAAEKNTLFSIKQMHLAGYFQQSKQLRAIVMFPNGEAQDVSVGEKLGREKAIVTDISENEMVVQLQHKQWKIKNEEK